MNFESTPIAITVPNSPVAIMHFITTGRGDFLPNGAVWLDQASGWWKRPVTDTLIREQIARAFSDRPALPTVYRIITAADIPADRTYRNALGDDGKALKHDMVKARNLHRDYLRQAREPLLQALDVEAMRADEVGDAKKKADAIKRKQALREITNHPDIEAAQDVVALKAVTLGLL